jgi:hypothetical protein
MVESFEPGMAEAAFKGLGCEVGATASSQVHMQPSGCLRIAVASIVPTITSGNTKAPARKSAELVLQDW